MAMPSYKHLAEATLDRIRYFEKGLACDGQDNTQTGAILLLSRAVLAVALAINELQESKRANEEAK